MKKRGAQFQSYLEGGLGLEDIHPSLSHGNKVPLTLRGEPVKHIMARAGITKQPVPYTPDTDEGPRMHTEMRQEMPHRDEPLNTNQTGLSAPTLQNYGKGYAPETNEYTGEPYVPNLMTDTYDSGREYTWIIDGHHRIISNRLGNNRANAPD